MNNCDFEKCYKCPKYETCELRFNRNAAPILLGTMLVGLIAIVFLGLGLFFYGS